jgi:hypothetical protein
MGSRDQRLGVYLSGYILLDASSGDEKRSDDGRRHCP